MYIYNTSNKPLIILTGATAVGKTSLSIKLSKLLNGEIISADSMQVYKGMDIGTAKIKTYEMEGIKHHLIDILNPEDDFNVVIFKKLALSAIEDIYNRGHIPIVTGGTGFYIQALLYDINFQDTNEDNSYRDMLYKLASEHGNEYVHNMLKEVDEEAANSIHFNNVKRVIRALEYYKETGQKISCHNKEQKENVSPFNFAYFVLNDDRQLIYDRINKRMDIMIEEGLIDEVTRLKNSGYTKDLVSMQGIGYKEVFDYLDGFIDYETLIDMLKQDTRHFAKRQITWFKREKDVIWLNRQDLGDDSHIIEYILCKLKERGIINE